MWSPAAPGLGLQCLEQRRSQIIPPKLSLAQGAGGKRHSMSQLLPGWERHRVHLGLQFVLALSCCDPVKHERKGGR